MSFIQWAVIKTVKGLIRIICRVDEGWIEQVPMAGPLILVSNHINFLDIPLVFTHLQPRPLTAFVKVETWDNPIMGWLFNLYDAIPIERGAPDRTALHQGMAALKEGKILAISPEGTRSNDGCLKRGYPGVALVAQISRAPLLPLVFYGGENFHQNFHRLRRTDFHIRVGRQFWVNQGDRVGQRDDRQAITDEIMYQLAALLPLQYRGSYSNLEKATTKYLTFEPASA
jgi:1-acyl-sn-glycerol-3-phosphate acyltransferase